ncbi:MAG: divalent-cation tolerance protein CutA [Pseudomonadota bacterium]
MCQPKLLYVTAPSMESAKSLASTLVEKRAAACVNILPKMHSIYRWKDNIETAEECVLIVKTVAAKTEAVRDMIIAAHPYETPCVIELSADGPGTNTAFAEWIAECVEPGKKE